MQEGGVVAGRVVTLSVSTLKFVLRSCNNGKIYCFYSVTDAKGPIWVFTLPSRSSLVLSTLPRVPRLPTVVAAVVSAVFPPFTICVTPHTNSRLYPGTNSGA